MSTKEGRIVFMDDDCTSFIMAIAETGEYCKIKDLTCVISDKGISCVRGSMF